MRFLPFLLVALPLAAAMPAVTDASSSLEARAAKSCSQSSQCGGSNNFCNRSKCDSRKKLGADCYKAIGCISNSCQSGKCAEGSALTLGERCETSKSCASTYCGNSKCQQPAANGASCYKAAGCQSGVCTNQKCVAPANASPSDEQGNIAKNNHFENDVIAPWYTYGNAKKSDADATAYDGKQYAIMQVAKNDEEYCYMSQEVEDGKVVTDNNDRRATDQKSAKAYDVSLQYRVPNFIPGANGVPCNFTVGFSDDYYRNDPNAVPTYVYKPEYGFTIGQKVGEWTKFTTTISNNRTSISDIGFELFCKEGGTIVHVDDVQFVPTAFPEDAPTDVARNGGFENGGNNADPWEYKGDARVSTNNPTYGSRYAVVHEASSIAQNITISSTAPEEGYYQYDVVYQYKINSVSSAVTADTPCTLTTVVNGNGNAQGSQTFSAASTTYATYSQTVTANQYIERIELDVTCPSGTATVFIDQVQFKPPTQN